MWHAPRSTDRIESKTERKERVDEVEVTKKLTTTSTAQLNLPSKRKKKKKKLHRNPSKIHWIACGKNGFSPGCQPIRTRNIIIRKIQPKQ